jgi:hypothetical protein
MPANAQIASIGKGEARWCRIKSSIISGNMDETPSLIQIKGIRDGLLIA